jgi:hypothetical protein
LVSGVWDHPAFRGLSRLHRTPADAIVALGGRGPPARRFNGIASERTGISDSDQLVGDYKSPILQPWAAAIVKRFGEMSLAGITFPNPSNQCWPQPMPFIFKQFMVQMIQQPDKITMLYSGDHEVRRVRMNASHPSPLKPSWYGDSVGHYEGDTLVIDTVGVNRSQIRDARPVQAPYTEAACGGRYRHEYAT